MTSTTTATKKANAEVDAWAKKLARLRNRKPLERTVTFHDEDLVEKADKVETALGRVEALARKEASARLGKDSEAVDEAVDADERVVEARADLVKAEKARDRAQIVLTLRALGSDVWEALVAEHPPTEKQAKLGQEYNVDTFAPALVAATSVDPMTVTQAAELIGGTVVDDEGTATKHIGVLNAGEAGLVFTGAVAVNTGARASLGKG